MTTSALIDLVLSYVDNISATDADNATRRARILQAAQEIFDEVWNFREWEFKITNSTVTVLASGNNVVTPSDFQDFGEHGAVYDSTGRKLKEITPQQLLKYRELATGTGSVPDAYSLFDYDSTTGRRMFQITNTVSGATNFKLWYSRNPPTLVDSTSNSNNLFFVPVQYHSTVMLPGVAWKTRRVKGDTRDWYADYQRGLGFMTLRERPRKDQAQQLARAVIGSW